MYICLLFFNIYAEYCPILSECLFGAVMIVITPMKLLFISIGAIFLFIISLATTRFWGLGQQYPEFQHPFFSASETPLVILKAKNLDDIDQGLKKYPNIAIWLDIETTREAKLIAINSELKDIVAKYPHQRFALNILSNVERVHESVVNTLKPFSKEKLFLVQSNYNVIMSSIKNLEPFWLYGCSQADLMRFLAYDSLWVLPAAPFKGDVFISPFKLLGRTAFNEDILTEIRRRNKKIILGPIGNKAEFDDASRLKADGLLIENLSDFLAWTGL